MTSFGPEYAEANARFKQLSDEQNASKDYDLNVAAANRWAAQQEARLPKAEGPSEAEVHLQMMTEADRNARAGGLDGYDLSNAKARVAAEQATKATEAGRSQSIGNSMVKSDMPAPVDLNSLPPAPPLPGQDGLIDPSNLTASQLAQFGYASVDPRTIAMGQDAFQSSMAGIKREQAALLNSTDAIAKAEKEAQLAAEETYQTAAFKNEAMAPVAEEASRLSAERATAVKQLVADSSAETKAQMVRVRQTADEAANAQIKDFWADKTTGGRIMGIISQALAGAANGLSGQPGASTPLDKVMAADLERQRINLNQKTTTSYREQGILGLMRQNFDSSLQAGAAAYGAAVMHVDMLAKDISLRFATPEAKAAYDKFHAENTVKYEQAMASTHNAILSSEINKAQLSSTMISKLSSADMSGKVAATKAATSSGDLHILGLKGNVSKPVYQALHKQAASIGAVMANYQAVEDMTMDGVVYDENFRRKFNQLSAEIFAATRTRFDTGKKLEGKEEKQVLTAVPEITTAMLSELTPAKIFDFKQNLQNQMQGTVRSYLGYAKSVAGNDYDLNDPQVGSYIRALATKASK